MGRDTRGYPVLDLGARARRDEVRARPRGVVIRAAADVGANASQRGADRRVVRNEKVCAIGLADAMRSRCTVSRQLHDRPVVVRRDRACGLAGERRVLSQLAGRITDQVDAAAWPAVRGGVRDEPGAERQTAPERSTSDANHGVSDIGDTPRPAAGSRSPARLERGRGLHGRRRDYLVRELGVGEGREGLELARRTGKFTELGAHGGEDKNVEPGRHPRAWSATARRPGAGRHGGSHPARPQSSIGHARGLSTVRWRPRAPDIPRVGAPRAA